jgi:3-isopropylmalate/(R)-2-methylmalate dehydratase large subunit
MPFGKAWFRVPETIQIRLTGSHRPGVTPRDVTQWLIGEIGAIYKSLEFTGPYIERLGRGRDLVPAERRLEPGH